MCGVRVGWFLPRALGSGHMGVSAGQARLPLPLARLGYGTHQMLSHVRARTGIPALLWAPAAGESPPKHSFSSQLLFRSRSRSPCMPMPCPRCGATWVLHPAGDWPSVSNCWRRGSTTWGWGRCCTAREVSVWVNEKVCIKGAAGWEGCVLVSAGCGAVPRGAGEVLHGKGGERVC